MVNVDYVLSELRKLLFETINHTAMERMRIAELFERLDTSLSRGEHLPREWSNAVRPLDFPLAPHKCDVCGGIHQLPLCKAPSTPSVVERYICTKCPEKFGSVLALADHRLTVDH